MWRGEKALTAKFTQKQVDEIRAHFALESCSVRKFSKKYSISDNTMIVY